MQIMCSTFLGKEAENEEDVERKETKGILGDTICLAQFFDYSCICGISPVLYSVPKYVLI